MDPTDRRTNFLLKREVLALAQKISDVRPGTTILDYNLRCEDLDPMEISEFQHECSANKGSVGVCLSAARKERPCFAKCTRPAPLLVLPTPECSSRPVPRRNLPLCAAE